MSKTSYPALTAKQLIKILQKAGFEFKRQKGSHAIYEKLKDNGTILAVVIPMHSKKALKKGTLNNIISQSGMTKKEFYRYLSIGLLISVKIMRFLYLVKYALGALVGFNGKHAG